MSKITTNGLTRPGTGCWLCPWVYGNSGCQMVKGISLTDSGTIFEDPYTAYPAGAEADWVSRSSQQKHRRQT